MFPDLRSKYNSEVLLERDQVLNEGTFRQKVQYDLIQRPSYAFGLLAAADTARFCGIKKVLALEFGVALGDGLLNLCTLAGQVTQETGIEFEIYGFDTGSGLPSLRDYRDHPEIWSQGDFSIVDRLDLDAKLPSNARVIWGDVAETLPGFLENVTTDAPIGFVSIDLDIYHSSKSALDVFKDQADKNLPVVVSYFDDTLGGAARIGSLFRNRWSGQLLAIDEFNTENLMRKIDSIRTLRYRRPLFHEQWIEQMYGVHILDHPFRNRLSSRHAMSMQEHWNEESLNWLL